MALTLAEEEEADDEEAAPVALLLPVASGASPPFRAIQAMVASTSVAEWHNSCWKLKGLVCPLTPHSSAFYRLYYDEQASR